MRTYFISDDGDEFHLALLIDGAQVGNVHMLDGGSGSAFDWCRDLGEYWIKSGSGVSPITLNQG